MNTPRVADNFFDELMVVLVIYKMEISESPAFSSLTRALQYVNQKSSIFIYDNSPHPHTHTPNESWVVAYRNDQTNPGVSKAYNKGFELAKSQNKKWILLVDQDTVFDKDFFKKCEIAIEGNKDEKIFVPILHDSIGIVSPFHFRFGKGLRLKRIRAGQCRLAEKSVVNSGFLISSNLFELAGGFDERFELDFSDLVFAEKLKLIKRTFFVIDSTCKHSLFASSHQSLLDSLVRFKIYCHAADLFVKQTGNFWVMVVKHLRAVALFFQYFDWRFITFAFTKNVKQIQ